jgi:hypothetical protein
MKTQTARSNPYDHANPITDLALFAGRKKELSEAEYYLSINLTQKPIHLAVVGERASGKTSLVNAIAAKADDYKYLVARIDLNNDAVANDLAFFLELYESVLAAGVERGLWGGIFGDVYQNYRETIDTLRIPDKEFSVLLFPRQYASCLRGDNPHAAVSQYMVKRDLETIQAEIAKLGLPRIAIVVDECDLLATNETLLQKLRNLFSHLSGYMLVFTGTSKMFPAMDAVFSPVSRQFKKILVGPYDQLSEAIECIRKPLAHARQDSIIGLETMIEICELSQMNPYEIRLICHCMYRRREVTGAEAMVLTVEVLDEIIEEMERLQADKRRELLRSFKRLGERDLVLLGDVGRFTEGVTLEDALRLKLFLEDAPTDWSAEVAKWQEGLRHLTEQSIVNADDVGKIRFNGEDFDRLYLKYFASTKKIKLFWENQGLETLFVAKLWRRLLEGNEGRSPFADEWGLSLCQSSNRRNSFAMRL